MGTDFGRVRNGTREVGNVMTDTTCSFPATSRRGSSPSTDFLSGSETPIILTYLNRLPDRWLLGRSAALHGFPIAITGVGRKFNFADKLLSTRRAMWLLHTHNPRAPVIFADGLDTVVSNPLSRMAALRLQQASRSGTIIVGAECFSYPRCYRELYLKHLAHQACRASSPTCYANSGLYAGSSRALLRMLPKAFDAAKAGSGIEHNDDQAAMHRLILGGEIPMSVDADSTIFLNLHPCRGHPFKAPPMNGALKGKGQITMCFYQEHEPLKHLTANGSTLMYDTRAHRGRREKGTQRAGRGQRPLVTHANGMHTRLADAFFGKPGKGLSRVPGAIAIATGWDSVFPELQAVLDYPVLLLDSPTHGVCNISTVGRLQRHALDF